MIVIIKLMIKKEYPPTIGAVKEAIETGKEVIMQGPSDTDELITLKILFPILPN